VRRGSFRGFVAGPQTLSEFTCCEAGQTGVPALGAVLSFDGLRWCWLFAIKSRASELLAPCICISLPPAARGLRGGADPLSLPVRRGFCRPRESPERTPLSGDHDSVTGLFNRFWFHRRLGDEVAGAARAETEAGLLRIDLDRFSSVNELLGHETGDLVLQRIADRLLATVPEGALTAESEETCSLFSSTAAPREPKPPAGRFSARSKSLSSSATKNCAHRQRRHGVLPA